MGWMGRDKIVLAIQEDGADEGQVYVADVPEEVTHPDVARHLFDLLSHRLGPQELMEVYEFSAEGIH
jgi:hypothetical protein